MNADFYGPWRAFNDKGEMVVIFATAATIERYAKALGYVRWERDE